MLARTKDYLRLVVKKEGCRSVRTHSYASSLFCVLESALADALILNSSQSLVVKRMEKPKKNIVSSDITVVCPSLENQI